MFEVCLSGVGRVDRVLVMEIRMVWDLGGGTVRFLGVANGSGPGDSACVPLGGVLASFSEPKKELLYIWHFFSVNWAKHFLNYLFFSIRIFPEVFLLLAGSLGEVQQ